MLESGKLIAELGSGIMKFSISPQASFGKTKANVLERDPSLKTLTDVAGKEPAHRAVLDMPFTHFHIWAYPFTTHGNAGNLLLQMLVFVGILMVAYGYAWRKGVFKWD